MLVCTSRTVKKEIEIKLCNKSYCVFVYAKWKYGSLWLNAQMSLYSYLFSYFYYSQRIVMHQISAARQSKALLH